MSIKKSLLIQDIPVSYLECDLVIYLENHLSRSNEIVNALPRNMISLQQLPFLHPSHLAVAFIDRTPLPFIEEGSVKNMFYCLFTHLVLFYWRCSPFIGVISRPGYSNTNRCCVIVRCFKNFEGVYFAIFLKLSSLSSFCSSGLVRPNG